jgi:hypothetical protein
MGEPVRSKKMALCEPPEPGLPRLDIGRGKWSASMPWQIAFKG